MVVVVVLVDVHDERRCKLYRQRSMTCLTAGRNVRRSTQAQEPWGREGGGGRGEATVLMTVKCNSCYQLVLKVASGHPADYRIFLPHPISLVVFRKAVLGLILFIHYTTLSSLICSSTVLHLLYTDDTQLFYILCL